MKNTSRIASRAFAYGTILLSAVLFGTYGVWSRLMGPTFPPFYQAWVRSIIIMLIMLPFMLATKSFRKIKYEDWPQVGIFIAFCVFTQVPLYYAFNHAPIGTVQLVFYSTFVVTAYIVGRYYLGEIITKLKLFSMALAIAGLAIVFGESAIIFAPLGLALAGLNGIASGGEVSTTKKVSDKYSPALLVFWGWVFTLMTHLPLSLLLGEKQSLPHFDHAWLWLLIYSIVNTAAFWLVIVGYRFVDASIGALVGLTEIIFSVLFGILLFHEPLAWTVGIGGALILVAAMLPDLVNILKGREASEVLAEVPH
jgi:drug/metabolite transporter (DMT)-like permease